MIKIILIAFMSILLANCSQTYKVKQEANMKDNRLLNEVPQWYIDASIDEGLILNRDAEKYIYAVGQGSSPDLQLAIDKAKMIAKAEMADIIQGEMNKKIKIFVSELGNTQNKTIVNDVESALVNTIKETQVRGYEVFAQEVTMTTGGYYRAWIGLRLPLGEFNKMYNYSIATVVDAYEL